MPQVLGPRDQGAMFTAASSAVFAVTGVRIIKIPMRAPRTNEVAKYLRVPELAAGIKIIGHPRTCCATGPARTWIGSRTTSWLPTWPPPPDSASFPAALASGDARHCQNECVDYPHTCALICTSLIECVSEDHSSQPGQASRQQRVEPSGRLALCQCSTRRWQLSSWSTAPATRTGTWPWT